MGISEGDGSAKASDSDGFSDPGGFVIGTLFWDSSEEEEGFATSSWLIVSNGVLWLILWATSVFGA